MKQKDMCIYRIGIYVLYDIYLFYCEYVDKSVHNLLEFLLTCG